ncbi:cation transporting P-type ATPase [Sulfurimonas gotlandica GD1]|uniref:Copper-transporting ATPase n=1 Tax=Sulfurimonas gotlandica (strain DSM 19862 / JCM 16533 / GD1) TaxID=929558 RepID=B6BGJ9_SULGG|nr:copper-translocating P-type ATPase [Sulfurimonas gotlandica]EDZ63677.1 copper-translocating P-type ATPase [Sulfurimonas gotlandica GD1]EHP29626.1 cation transporting P-type ATPase [Sulfurimonas gotlandica GD1]
MSVKETNIYTCPMHLEIKQDHPGSCPKCGMALEPIKVQADEENDELTYMSRRFWISLFISLPLFIVAMTNDLAPELLPESLSMLSVQWFLFILATPVVLWGGWPFFVRGYLSVKTWNLNMFTLIAIGVGSSYIYSVFALLVPHTFPPLMQTEDGLVHVYFEASAVITTLVLLGQMLELKARSKTTSAIKTLLNLSPAQAHKIDNNGNEEIVSLESVLVDDILRIKPGEKIPVDGVVIGGHSNVDESMITGEAIPVPKSVDDFLIGATLNKNGTLLMRAVRVGSDTMLSEIIDMVAQAQRSRAPIQHIADKVAGYFVPAVIFSAIFTFFGWYMWGPEPRLAYAVVSAVAVLIIACPCALGLATPISIMVGTGRAALMGILIKDAQSLETMEKVTILVVDKTGTLTEGKPKVTNFIVSDGFDEIDVLRYAASLESVSEHPLAQAIVKHAKDAGLVLSQVDKFKAITARGIIGEIDDKKIVLGSQEFINSLCIFEADAQKKIKALRKEDKGLIFMSIDFHLCAIFAIEDAIKPTSKEAIHALKKEGIKVVLISGDNKITANKVADTLGIDKVYSSVLPNVKAEIIKELQDAGEIVAMAGDGINDAPALMQANVGIAMGTGTDVAINSAGITLIKGDLLGIVKVRKLSYETMKNIRQNLFFAFIYNSAGIPIAAGLFYPLFGVLLSPVIAAAAMSFSSVSVITNALQLRNIKIG